MVLAHNLYAVNAQRQCNITGTNKKKSVEKLASGFKINRAADDAAGLAISEKMRKQIRGLDRGASNIQEGISLIQTADGALGEVIDILQRIRELSIQSYNETNSESDIAAMQAEVDEALKEIDRIGEATTFNEKRIFQGGDTTFGGVSAVSHYESQKVFRTLPSWLMDKSDEELKPHNYSYTQTCIDKPMYQTINRVLYGNGSDFHDLAGNEFADGTCIYFGPQKTSGELANEVWYGITEEGFAKAYDGWTDTLMDNPTAKLDFSGLLDVSDVDELYLDMFNLLGTSVTYPCGSCTNHQGGIFFSGEEDNFRAIRPLGYVDGSYYQKGDKLQFVDLCSEFQYDMDGDGTAEKYSSYYDVIKKLKEKQETDTMSTEQEKKKEVQVLADAIARNLAGRVCGALTAAIGESHFDRVIPVDAYAMVVYDFRDEDALRIKGITEVGVVNRTGLVEIAEKSEDYKFCSVAGELMIHAGPEAEDKIEITLPKISLEELGLIGYRVGCQYTTEIEIVYEEDESLKKQAEKEYEEAMEQYKKDMEEYEIAYQAWLSDSHTENISVTVRTLAGYNYDNGERKNPIYNISSVPKSITVYHSEQPKMPEMPIRERFGAREIVTYRKVYNEHVLDPVDDALAKVLRARSILGAQQNRLEHAYLINKNTSENTTAAESRIRDTDMAEEMVNYSKHNILGQVGEAMIAQANQIPQGVLSLLQ